MESDGIEWFGRLSGPLNLRLVVQPVIAIILGYRDGVKDAASGAPPYLWSLTNAAPDQRKKQIRDGWSSIGMVFAIAVILDCVFQYLVTGKVAIVGAIVFAAILAIIPYLLFRGLVNRWKSRQPE